ncbi:peptidyl-prolyl cis-trans isomerase FKBP43 isoform X2 [Sesamum indicum]|uniref:peptidylprolyl isomerase n=1 Tax=Sesamum indicum TaxID=4182 RepID=A0A6I9U6E0_SESIN|nr:peptidyl-prolyl cis-trans isomerase FKBP43 isoform X2 [Sesamum indicum]
MAFWGIEVKPGKPITHSCEKARGRLRISQATLGISDATKKSIVQCNVGKRSPVLLCALLPNQTESCHLDLEFEEADDVVFSVIGPRSVYLTGYYVRQSQQSNPHSDTESYGVDIENSQTEGSSYCSEDDKYEDSFIDDEESEGYSPSPVSSSKENDKLKNRKDHGKRLKKKFQVVESDDDTISRESEDEDGYLLSVFKSKKAAKTTLDGVGENIAQATTKMGDKSSNDGKCGSKSKEKIDPEDINGKPESAKPKRKRKACSNEEKSCEVESDDHSILREDKEHEVEVSTKLEVGASQSVPPPELSSENCKKAKKRRKKLLLEGASTEGIGMEFHKVDEGNKLEQDLLHVDTIIKDLPAADGDQDQHSDDIFDIKSELPANVGQPEKKIKKKMKKKKTQDEGDLKMGLPNTSDNQQNTIMKDEDQTKIAEPIQKRTLSNGLIIEEMVNGPRDGKAAAAGKKVKIYYTAMLKESGHIFDSNVGKTACKFRLGDEEIISGWNIGIDGMHVGDKRRLIIPPSMGYGKHGAGENVPPNSWLVYDVELVGVRK